MSLHESTFPHLKVLKGQCKLILTIYNDKLIQIWSKDLVSKLVAVVLSVQIQGVCYSKAKKSRNNNLDSAYRFSTNMDLNRLRSPRESLREICMFKDRVLEQLGFKHGLSKANELSDCRIVTCRMLRATPTLPTCSPNRWQADSMRDMNLLEVLHNRKTKTYSSRPKS